MENNGAPYVNYLSQLLDAKVAPILSTIKNGVARNNAPSQQGGDEIENVILTKPTENVEIEPIRIKSPYVVPKSIKGSDAPKVQIGRRSMKRQLDDSVFDTHNVTSQNS